MSDVDSFSVNENYENYFKKNLKQNNEVDFENLKNSDENPVKNSQIDYLNTISEIEQFLKVTNSENPNQRELINKIKSKNNDLSKIGLDAIKESTQRTYFENDAKHTSSDQKYIKKINEVIDDLIEQKTRIVNLELGEYKLQNSKLENSLVDLKQKSINDEKKDLTELILKISKTISLNGQQTIDALELQLEFEKLMGHSLKNQINEILSDLIKSVNDQEFKIKKLRSENYEKEIKLNQTERLSAIGELTSRVAHDLRNPLSVMKGSIDLLKIKNKINFDESLSRHYEIMSRAISRMSAQIEDVLDFIRPTPLKVSKNSLLETIRHSMEKLKMSNKIKLELPEKDVELEYDDKKIDVVFDNLLTNSKQAIDGEGKISITFEEMENDIIVNIQDSGPGIPEDIIDSIFDPLVTTKQTGTGLGLASCLRIIQEHHGSISVKSNPTVFSITLPKSQKNYA